MHAYRTHTCAALRASDAGSTVRLSGWVHRKRDHGGVLFMDLRDHYGLTQCVVGQGSPVFAAADALRPESVVTVTGEVVRREGSTVNPKLPTGEVEVREATRTLLAQVDGGVEVLEAVLTALRAAAVDVAEVGLRRPTLDDVFLRLTGHAAEDAEGDDEEDRQPVGATSSGRSRS